MGTVNKGNLIREVAAKTSAPEAFVKDVVEHLLERITSHAEAGDTITLIGFGKFQVRARAARIGRNPGTGLPVDIAESRTLTFKAAKTKAA
jgi:DNA-binding protein HU-beta